MRKFIANILAVLMVTGSFTACGNKDNGKGGTNNDGEKLSVVTTIFPEYDWVMNILGDKATDADVTMLLDNGVDLHSFQPTADDIIKISSCDVFIYIGGESDEWVEDALKEVANKDMVVVNLLDSLGDAVKEEELVEGMEEHEHEHDHEEEEYDEEEHDEENEHNEEDHDEEEHEHEYDEHVWLSLKNASALCTVSFLAEKVDELDLSSVLTLEGTEHKIAETVVSATKSQSAQILSMDSMQSTTSEDIKGGTTYLSVMEKNLDVLKTALE